MTAGVGYGGIYATADSPASMAYPPGHIENLLVSRASASTVQIAVGSCRDDSNSQNIDVVAALTADITVAGANGRNSDTAEQANKWYAVYVIKNLTTGTVAAFLINEDDLGAFTWPAGYTVKRRIGWIRNDGASDLRDGEYFGLGSWRKWHWYVARTSLLALNNGNAVAYANVDVSEWVPPTSNLCEINMLFDPFGVSIADLLPGGGTVANPPTFYFESTDQSSTVIEQSTDASQIVQYKVGNINDSLDLYMCGFFDSI